MTARQGLSLGSRLLESLVTGRGAYLALFLLVHAVLAATTAGFTVLDVLELVLIGGPYSVLIATRRMTPGLAIPLAACLIAAAGLAAYALPTDGRPPGYEAWVFGAIAFVLLGVTVTGRYLLAWLVLVCVAGVAVGWSISTGQGYGPGLQLVIRHFATLLVGTLFAMSYRRSNAAFAAHQLAERRDRAAETAAEARAVARRVAAESVLEQAGPMLRAIAAGRAMSDSDKRELLVLEGSLRDQIRAPWLARGALKESVAAARRRGVNVLLLDETQATGEAESPAEAAAWLADRLDAVDGEHFVGRVRRTEDGLRVTAVAGASSEGVSLPAANREGHDPGAREPGD